MGTFLKKNWWKILIAIFVINWLFRLGNWYFLGAPLVEKPIVLTPAQIALGKIDRSMAQVKSARAIKESLKNPDSYQQTGVKTWIIDTLERKVGVYIEYRAQNGFGGMNVEKAMFSVDSNMIATRSE